MLFRLDIHLFRLAKLTSIYPRNPWAYWIYFSLVSSSGLLAWAGRQVALKRQLLTALTRAFSCAGLKNRMNQLPQLIFDKPIDEYTRRLKVTNAGHAIAKFQEGKPTLESSLRIYIDEIRENRSKGTAEITYSHLPMPEVCNFDTVDRFYNERFAVGQTRARQLTSTLEEIPHLLVAGQTSSGKSTFLRQLITTLFLNNKSYEFTLIDLKAALEFQLFENLPRTVVIGNLSQAVIRLNQFQNLMEQRLKLLKANKCKDLSAFLRMAAKKTIDKMIDGQAVSLNRHLVVIDEAADIFLAGSGIDTSEVQRARRILVEIARKGRAAGIHIIIATQRPDAKSIDPQIKANLPGILCFQMPNDASSMVVLGNGRATELPAIPGRALWKSGNLLVEVQTPFLSPEKAEAMLEPHRVKAADVTTKPTIALVPTVNDVENTDTTYENS